MKLTMKEQWWKALRAIPEILILELCDLTGAKLCGYFDWWHSLEMWAVNFTEGW